MRYRFTLSHDVLGSVEIDAPDGWKGSEIVLERHEQFYSLVERYEGSAEGAFIFYGDNGEVNGGIDFIKQVEQTYGFNAVIEFTAEFAHDDINFEEVFTGKLALHLKNEMVDNRMQVPVIRDDFWTKFINRMELPVDFSSLTDVDGNTVDPAAAISVNLTPQKIRARHYSYEKEGLIYAVTQNYYGQFQPDFTDLDELSEYYNLVRAINSDKPTYIIYFEYDGQCTFDLLVEYSRTTALGYTSPRNIYDWFLQKNDETPIEFTYSDHTYTDASVYAGWSVPPGTSDTITTKAVFNQTISFVKGDVVRIYLKHDNSATGHSITFWGEDGTPGDGSAIGAAARPAGMVARPTYFDIRQDTIHPESQAQGYLIHDAINYVLSRIGLGSTSPLYSDFLGSTVTNSKTYSEDGCGWMYAIFKGLQFREYTLTEKPFFSSFKQLWDGINPILNLGLGYEEAGSSPDGKLIRIEQKISFFDETMSLRISNVRDISSSYDAKHIFKSVRTGYKKWESEDRSGIDDPQTKHTYSTIIEPGTDLILESEFIAAGLAIETTRRKSREKTEDYKFDNDTFIIALKEADVSPDVYAPELAEHFNSVTGVLNSDTRYNLILTPMRNLLRWANVLGGCLQMYTNTSYKFMSGEGNYDMVSDYSCGSGNQCQAIICDSLGESQDIPLGAPANYNSIFGYMFYPMLYDIIVPMEWEDFDIIRNAPKQAIGISQTDIAHQPFFIKSIRYNILKAEAVIQAWPREYFDIQVIQGDYTAPGCPVERSLSSSDDAASEEEEFDEDYQAILDYAQLQGYTLPSDAQQIIQNQFVLELKEEGIWEDLDLLYVFATDGGRDFARINWISPGSFTCTETNTPTFTTNEGFTGNGLAAGAGGSRLNTGWIPGTNGVNLTQNEGGFFLHLNNAGSIANRSALGCLGPGLFGAGQIVFFPDSGGFPAYGISSAAGAATTATSAGFFHAQRLGATSKKIFKNGVADGTSSNASATLTTRELRILTRDQGGVIDPSMDGQISIFGIGASLTGKESGLYDAWNNYFNAL